MRVAGPGKHEAYYRANNPKGLTMREMSGEPVRSVPAFHSGPAHLKMMDELGVHAAIVFPTLAPQDAARGPSLIEQSVGGPRSDPGT